MEAAPAGRSFLYDANCIVYHCFHAVEAIKMRGRREKIEFKYPRFTDQVHAITNFLCARGIRIETVEEVWAEIETKGLAEIVHEYVNSAECPLPPSQVRPYVELHLYRKFRSKLSELKDKPWFRISSYDPSQEELDLVISAYRSLEKSPKMKGLMRSKRRTLAEPGLADMILLLYSRARGLPILSNDADLTLFRSELEEKGVCYKIVPLSEISDPSTLAKIVLLA